MCSRLLVTGQVEPGSVGRIWQVFLDRYELQKYAGVSPLLGGFAMFDDARTEFGSLGWTWSNQPPTYKVRMRGLSKYVRSAAAGLDVSPEKLSGVVPIVPGVKTKIRVDPRKLRYDGRLDKGGWFRLTHKKWAERWPAAWWGAFVREHPDEAVEWLDDVATKEWLLRKNVSLNARISLLVDGYPKCSTYLSYISPTMLQNLAADAQLSIARTIGGLKYVTKPALEGVAELESIKVTRRLVLLGRAPGGVSQWAW
jgi:hypothetical protein